MKRSLVLLILFLLPCELLAQPLYIVEGARGVVTFTNRKPLDGAKYSVAGENFGYVSKVKAYEIYPYSRGRFAKFRPSSNRHYDPIITSHSERFGVDSHLVKAVIHVESAFRSHARSPKGALGLMQIMPGTARRFGVSDVLDPHNNIFVGVKYLSWLLDYYQGKEVLALAAYNAGEGAVDKYRGIPPYTETRNYVQKVLRAKRAYRCLSEKGAGGTCVF